MSSKNHKESLRAKSRRFFPNWSRRMRAKWVLKAAQASGACVPIGRMIDLKQYQFAREVKW